jgi:hypothetical protein
MDRISSQRAMEENNHKPEFSLNPKTLNPKPSLHLKPVTGLGFELMNESFTEHRLCYRRSCQFLSWLQEPQ